MPLVNWLHRTATLGRLLMIAIVSVALRYGLMPRMGAKLMSTPHAGPLDLMFAYTPTVAFAHIAALSDEGRQAYRLFLVTADVAYPVSYVLLFAWLIIMLKRNTRWERSCFPVALPLSVFGFDMLENVSIIGLLTAYPAQPVALALTASIFTTLKWIMAGASILVILLLVLLRISRAISRR